MTKLADPLLQVRELGKAFPVSGGAFRRSSHRAKAVDGVEFSLHRGETLGIVGESGCGKTTLARMLLRLIEPDAGEILFRGEDWLGASGAQLMAQRRHMQMVFQDPVSSLNPRMRVGSIVGEPLEIHQPQLSRTDRRARVAEMLENVGMSGDLLARYPHEFSGGQRQRIGIARALILRPELVIADEPVSALDVSVGAQILELIANLQREFSLTLILISHSLPVVAQLATRIAVMRSGCFVEQGAADQVLQKPRHPYTQALLRAVPEVPPWTSADTLPRMAFQFNIVALDPTGARLGLLSTPHGTIETPAFMPVGTAATIKGQTQQDLETLGAQILLSNTYHLYLRPGHALIREMGGLHKFMSWPHPILTDSGGFQVFSLSNLRQVSDAGVTFRSHLDGSPHFLSPEKAIEIEVALGADIIMAFDECIEALSDRSQARQSAARTLDWARRSRDSFETSGDSARQMLFGIVQGGMHADLRRDQARALVDLDFPGYAVGGLAVGEPHEVSCEIAEVVAPLLPFDRPRYVMGVGKPEQILDYVARGIDMMDCVLPTRSARHGCLFTSEGRVLIGNARYARDSRPIDEHCSCAVCRRYSRSYLRHLYSTGEFLAIILNTHHNLHFYLDMLRKIREAIRFGMLEKLRSDVQASLAQAI